MKYMIASIDDLTILNHITDTVTETEIRRRYDGLFNDPHVFDFDGNLIPKRSHSCYRLSHNNDRLSISFRDIRDYPSIVAVVKDDDGCPFYVEMWVNTTNTSKKNKEAKKIMSGLKPDRLKHMALATKL